MNDADDRPNGDASPAPLFLSYRVREDSSATSPREGGDSSVSTVVAPRIPDFELLRCIGEGGFGQVWLAVNRTTGQPRAVKVISRAHVGNRDPAGREIASLVRLEANRRCRHPNLLTIHHVGETAEHLFYVMDLADDLSDSTGTELVVREECAERDIPSRQSPPSLSSSYRPATLENRLAAGPLEANECQRYTRQLLAGLACLHEAGMVHRDVKPANCLFLGGELKLGDFGLLTEANLAGSRVGTLRYMPPDGCMDARADVFAAGLVIYEMLTGLPAERFPSLGDRAVKIAKQQPLAPLNRLALRACDPDRSRRFRDARQMLAGLDGAETTSTRSFFGARWAALGASLVVAAALAACWILWPQTVAINFVTEPFEAMVYVDGQLLHAADGTAYRTPCTIRGLAVGRHHVLFQWDAESGALDLPGTDGKVDAGTVDFAADRQITARPKAD